jgi:hypothetical protein
MAIHILARCCVATKQSAVTKTVGMTVGTTVAGGSHFELEYSIRHREFTVPADAEARAQQRQTSRGTGQYGNGQDSNATSSSSNSSSSANDPMWGYLKNLLKRLLEKDPKQVTVISVTLSRVTAACNYIK